MGHADVFGAFAYYIYFKNRWPNFDPHLYTAIDVPSSIQTWLEILRL